MAITIDDIFDRLQERLADNTIPLLLRNTKYTCNRRFYVPDGLPPRGCVALPSGAHVIVTAIESTISLEHPTGDFVYDFSAEYADPKDIEDACDIILYFIEHEHLPKL